MLSSQVLAGLLALFVIASVATAQQQDYLKAFPPAAEGMTRFVIRLPHKDRGEEDAFKVELIVGKTMLTDGVNRVSLGAVIKEQPLQGWGFTYYEVAKFGPVASTLIGVPPGTPQVESFVSGQPHMIRYNSRVPVVVYVPKGGEVRYRIWQQGKSNTAEEG